MFLSSLEDAMLVVAPLSRGNLPLVNFPRPHSGVAHTVCWYPAANFSAR